MEFFKEPLGVAIGAATAASAAALTYYMTSKPDSYTTPVDMENQSILLPDGSRTSIWAPTGKDLVTGLYDGVKTLHDVFMRGLSISEHKPCLGSRTGPNREYQWLTYREVYERSCDFGSGLLQEGLEANNDTFIGIYSINRAEWVFTEKACNMFSMVTVALYDTLGPETCAYVINQTQMTTVICDKAEKAQLLLDKANSIKTLKTLIIIDEISGKNKETAAKHDIKLLRFKDVLENGRRKRASPVPPNEDDLAMICYTSGTTGDPKGVMVSHKNLISNLSAIALYCQKCHMGITYEDTHLSYLPLAHVFERGMQILMFMHGGKTGFFSGDVKLLTDDMQALRPTVFPTPPRLLNRIYDKVTAGVKDSLLKATLLQWALQAKEKDLKRRIIRKNTFWDKLVFKKIQDSLGGRVRLVFAASAPLEPRVLNFVRCAFGCVVVEGYGQTEIAAGISINIPGEYISGHVGPPLPCTLVKLVDVPEMDYYANDNKGEIICKGPSVFIGYYKNPEKTRETIDEDGWLHTGDIGEWLPNGTLKVIDRKKHIFKLAQGEYVAPEKIQNTYMRSQFVAQAFVEGDSFQPYLMGVIVPDEEVIMPWARQNGVQGSFREVCARQDVKQTILQDILSVGKASELKGFEQVKDIYIFTELFSVENGLLTPTFKTKRPQLRNFFKKQIQELYAKHSPS